MPTWLRMLVIAVITTTACVDDMSRDEAHAADAHESSSRTNGAADGGLSSQDTGTGIARMLRDAGRGPFERREVLSASEPDAEADDDLDAGFAELAAFILRDCTETLRCDTEPASSLENCIAVSTNVLDRATPDGRQRFLSIVMRCSTLRACDYVSCARQR